MLFNIVIHIEGECVCGLDPVYDRYVNEISIFTTASGILVASPELKFCAKQMTLFDWYHVADPPENCQALSLFVFDVVQLLQHIRFVEKALDDIRHLACIRSLPDLATRCAQLASCTKIRVDYPALLSFKDKRPLFERNNTSSVRTQPTYSPVEQRVRQEVLLKIDVCRSWSLWLDGFFNAVPSNDSSSETLLMLSEEKAVRTIAYSSLSYSLRQELYKFNGTTAGSC